MFNACSTLLVWCQTSTSAVYTGFTARCSLQKCLNVASQTPSLLPFSFLAAKQSPPPRSCCHVAAEMADVSLTGEVWHLTTCFLQVISIIFFPIYLQAWRIAWMFARPKVTRPRPRRYIFKTETRLRRWTLKTETRPRRSIFPNSRDRDETETRPRRSTFKTEMRQDVPKNVWRLPRDWDVQDRDYIPDTT